MLLFSTPLFIIRSLMCLLQDDFSNRTLLNNCPTVTPGLVVAIMLNYRCLGSSVTQCNHTNFDASHSAQCNCTSNPSTTNVFFTNHQLIIATMSEHKESVSQFFCLHFHSLIHSLTTRHFIACLHLLNLNFTQHFAHSCHSLHVCYSVVQHTSVEHRHLHCHSKLCSCRVNSFTWHLLLS